MFKFRNKAVPTIVIIPQHLTYKNEKILNVTLLKNLQQNF